MLLKVKKLLNESPSARTICIATKKPRSLSEARLTFGSNVFTCFYNWNSLFIVHLGGFLMLWSPCKPAIFARDFHSRYSLGPPNFEPLEMAGTKKNKKTKIQRHRPEQNDWTELEQVRLLRCCWGVKGVFKRSVGVFAKNERNQMSSKSSKHKAIRVHFYPWKSETWACLKLKAFQSC